MRLLGRLAFPIGMFLLTCFGVFVLPFLLPPPVIAGVSAANAAGFNNKVAAVAAAILSFLILLKELRWPSIKVNQQEVDNGPLAPLFVLAIAAFCGVLIAILGRLIVLSHFRYLTDAGYFIEQISSHVDYGRKLYDQIEFPYGPLLFYTPILLRAPFHLSAAGAYFTTFVLQQVAGLLMVGYIINSLPMRRVWKMVAFLVCAPLAIELSFGLNYTLFRFAVAPACLVLTANRSRLWETGLCLFLGQIISFSVSPEMGFAFAIAGTVCAVLRSLTEGKAWLVAAAIPAVAMAVFLVAVGGAYLRMLRLFAHGLYNLVVEPVPHILIFLFALIWLVPLMLATYLRDRRPEAPLLGSLYIFVLVLLPVAFGRADPGHVALNGLILFFLSIIGVSSWKPNLQVLWILCVSFVFLWAAYIDGRPFGGEFRAVIHDDLRHYAPQSMQLAAFRAAKIISPRSARTWYSVVYDADAPFDMKKLRSMVGGLKVATPYQVPLHVEESLKQSGQYTPSFYCFHIAMLDALSEERKIGELNRSMWAVLPKALYTYSETPASTAVYLGFGYAYRIKHHPYVTGECFNKNLVANWQAAGDLGEYQIYRRNNSLTPDLAWRCSNSD